MNYNEKTILEYVNNVSEKSSVPGGGSVLALVNELSASLLLMVARFTLNKKGYEEYNERALEVIDILEDIKEKCHKLIDEDASSFSNLMKAYSTKDNNKISECALEAFLVPKKLYLEAKSIMVLAQELIENGNKNLVSDAQIAYDLAKSSLEHCLKHMEINISSINSDEIKNKCLKFIESESKNYEKI